MGKKKRQKGIKDSKSQETDKRAVPGKYTKKYVALFFYQKLHRSLM